MIKPPFLKKGDRIGIVSPAKTIKPAEVKAAVRVLQRWGLVPVFGRHLYSAKHQFAGSDDERTEDIQEFLDDNSIKAILSSRGGYGSARIIDHLDFSNFVEHPKWVIGYSDITVFHNHIHTHFNIETLHAVMPINFPLDFSENDAVKSLGRALFGDLSGYKLFDKCEILREGKAEGVLVGGNLSMLYSLSGTNSDINTKGKILFIEDLDEYLYHVDRMMMNLKKSGKLENLKGLIVGGMTDMNDNTIPFGATAEEIIWDAVKEYDYPVITHFPAGHQEENSALFLGAHIQIDAKESVFELSFL